MTVRLAFTLLVLVVVVAAPRRVFAGDPLAVPTRPEAVEHWTKATEAVDAGDYDAAVAEYSAGALVEDLPFWDWNLCKTHQKAGHFKLARWYCGRYVERLERAPNINDDVRDAIEGARVNLATIDEAEQREAERAPVSPPPSDAMDPVGVDEPPPSPGRWTTQRKVALGVAVLGVAALGGGLWLGSDAEGLREDAAAACPPGCTTEEAERANHLAEQADRRVDAANITFGAAAVLVVGAVVLWLTGGPDQPGASSSDVSVAPSVSTTGGGLSLVGRF